MTQLIVVTVICVFVAVLLIKGNRAWDRRSAERNQRRYEAELQKTEAGVPGKPERSFLKSCTNCGAFILAQAFRDQLGRTYCSETCMKWMGEGRANRVYAPTEESSGTPVLFCERCKDESTEKSIGNLFTMNGIGAGLYGASQRCPDCDSVIRRIWICVIFVPLIPLDRYRVIHPSPNQFFSRRLR